MTVIVTWWRSFQVTMSLSNRLKVFINLYLRDASSSEYLQLRFFVFKYLRSLIFITLITDLGSVANLTNDQSSGIPATKLHAFDISCQLLTFTIDITKYLK